MALRAGVSTHPPVALHPCQRLQDPEEACGQVGASLGDRRLDRQNFLSRPSAGTENKDTGKIK